MVTWQTYQHVVKGMQSGAAEKVANLIFGVNTGGVIINADGVGACSPWDRRRGRSPSA
jgi:hypothetical protein